TAQERQIGDRLQCVLLEDELRTVVLEHPLVLLDERVLGLTEDLHEGVAVKVAHGRDDGQAADELRDEAELVEVLRLEVLERVLLVLRRVEERAEADPVLAAARRDDLVEAGEGP